MSFISVLFGQEADPTDQSAFEKIVIEKNLEFRQHTFFLLYAALILGCVIQTLIDPGIILQSTIILSILIFFFMVGSILQRNSLPSLASILWSSGINMVLLLAIFNRGDQNLLLLMVAPSFITGVLLGPRNAILTTLIWTLFLLFISSQSVLPIPYPFSAIIVSALSSGFVSIIGGLVHNLFLEQVSSLANLYLKAQTSLEEARNNQLEYNQVKEDLLLANKEMARLTERLRGMSQIAESARQAKEEFVANVSHELRTPLNMIIGFTETITRNPSLYGVRLPKKLLEDLSIIERNSRHLSDLINDVLDLSQVEAGRMAITRKWADFKTIIQESVDQIQPLFQAKNLYLQVNIPSESMPVFCDDTRIKEVLINLISNAGRFTEAGGVSIALQQHDSEYIVSVSDTGLGIPENQLEAIFEPFRQVDGTIRRQHGGTGLGLTISKRFVEMHEGRIWVESRVGEGSTFYFSLPSEPPKTSFQSNNLRWIDRYNSFLPRTRRFKAPIPELTPRFLVYEQGETIAKLFKRYMDQSDIEVVHTQEALKEALETPSTAIIINTSEIGSDEVNQISKNIPLGTLLFTCFIPSYQEFARRIGVIDYLIKPITGEHLLATVEHYAPEAKTILFVDDQPEMLQLLSRFMDAAAKNYQLLFASNGREAVEIIRDQPPDLLFLDLVMPEMDGFALLEELRGDSIDKNIPVIVLSSRDPAGSPVISNALQVIKADGYTVNDIMNSIQLLCDLLTFKDASTGPTLPKEYPV